MTLLEPIDVLIENGADINAVEHNGRTPLHIAASRGIDSIKYLLANSNPETADRQGTRPLDLTESEVIQELLLAESEQNN